ncbi:Protein timeless like protein [Chelonia mydas]|uniref:Protein timeless like protein n=1 Tax=Chelonia mydas TaxID=8469 RepID=M7B665_CHEMY|nr:Protein timeless like protein [Chelonia mydas]
MDLYMMNCELLATCSALGYLEGDVYHKEPDCLESVKDLIRYLRYEDETRDVRQQLGAAQILQNDLLPLIAQYPQDKLLFDAVVRLMVNLTQPALLCFGKVPHDPGSRHCFLQVVSYLQAYKEAFASEKVFGVLSEKLYHLLQLDWEQRQEEDNLLVERILLLVRNVLHIPADPEEEKSVDDDASAHDRVLWAMHVSGMDDLLKFLASSSAEQQWGLHVLEIVSLMFRDQDQLLREKSQQHDETYYLWAMAFFMAFNRGRHFRPELVSETVSVRAFHFIEQNLTAYYEAMLLDKKEATSWARRMHLALKAYRELLTTVQEMDRSPDEAVRDSSRIIKNNIFYLMEYRELFLALFRKFWESRQPRSFLRDLVETTHLFLKMLEAFCRGRNNLVVQSKRVRRKKQPRAGRAAPPAQPRAPQELEELWPSLAEQLGACAQGAEPLPEDVVPFDAASETPVEEQRAEAMVRIQDSLLGHQAPAALTLLRSASWEPRVRLTSECLGWVWAGVVMGGQPRGQAAPEVEEPGEEEEEEEEEVEEELASVQVSEKEFSFLDYLKRFASASVVKAYVLLLRGYRQNSAHTNHCVAKMLHRIAYDLKMEALLFQLSVFCIFNRLLSDPSATAYKELVTFAKYILGKFFALAATNKKVYVELLFWKSTATVREMTEGYGSLQEGEDSGARRAPKWTLQEEEELRELYLKYKGVEDILGNIMKHLTAKRSKARVVEKLLSLGLVAERKELYKKRKRKPGLPGMESFWRIPAKLSPEQLRRLAASVAQEESEGEEGSPGGPDAGPEQRAQALQTLRLARRKRGAPALPEEETPGPEQPPVSPGSDLQRVRPVQSQLGPKRSRVIHSDDDEDPEIQGLRAPPSAHPCSLAGPGCKRPPPPPRTQDGGWALVAAAILGHPRGRAKWGPRAHGGSGILPRSIPREVPGGSLVIALLPSWWLANRDLEAGSTEACSSKRERKVHSLLEWVPLVSTYYNMGTSIYYAFQNCTELAKERGIEAALDLSYDVLLGLVGGPAGSLGLGIGMGLKPAIKVGVRSLISYFRQVEPSDALPMSSSSPVTTASSFVPPSVWV